MARGWHYTKLSLSSVLIYFSSMCFVLLFLFFLSFFFCLFFVCFVFVFMLSLELGTVDVPPIFVLL